METRLLIVASEWRLLSFACGALPEAGFRVLVEPSAEEALVLARRWRPDVIIICPTSLAAWDDAEAGRIERHLARVQFIVTVQQEDDPSAWEALLVRGFELLALPLMHPEELLAAAEAALTRRVNLRGPEGLGQVGHNPGPGTRMRHGTA